MTVTTRRERRQQQRRQQQQQRRVTGGGGSRRISGVWIAVIGIAVLVAVVLLARAMGILEPAVSTPGGFDINSVDASGQTLGEKQQDLGNAHVPSGQRVNYPSLPPTSGEHWPAPAAPAPWGIKTSTLPFEVSTHNLEHGGVVIYYAADLPTIQVDQLRSLVRSLQSAGLSKMVLEPWTEMPKESKVILTAWDWILKQPALDQAQIVKFAKQHHAGSDAPEANVP